MIANLKRAIKKTRKSLRDVRDLRSGLARLSYAQEGEDVVLSTLMPAKRAGFYVDVGAHHPKRFSNTYLFYRSGWSGINIDCSPSCMAMFAKVRPRDTNLEIAIAKEPGIRRMFLFEESGLNTMDPLLAKERTEKGWKLLEERDFVCKRLADVLLENCHDPIDIMNIDVEGLDLEVLQSNDWHRFRPSYVCVEALQHDADGTHPLLTEQGYRLLATTGRSRIYG